MIVPLSQQTTAAATLTLRRCECGGNPSQFVRYGPSLPLDNDPAKRFLSKNNCWRSSVRSVYRYTMPDFTIALAIGFVIGFVSRIWPSRDYFLSTPPTRKTTIVFLRLKFFGWHVLRQPRCLLPTAFLQPRILSGR